MKIRSLIKAACMSGLGSFLALAALTAQIPGGGIGIVNYNPAAKVVQGNQPLSQSYVLTITSPANLPSGVSTTVTIGKSILSKSNAAVPDETVLSFLSLAPAALTFTGPNQTLTTTVSVNVPLGQYAGSYAYRLKPSGWPLVGIILDEGATVNALVSPSLNEDSGPPSVVLQIPVDGTIYTYFPVSGQPVTVPIIFDATVGSGGQPITGLNAYLDGNPVSVTATGLGTLAATGTSPLSLTTPGLYNVRVTATNLNGTSEDEADFSVVVSAPPPTISVASPLANAVFTYQAGGSGVNVPISYTATSLYGNITATGASLNGLPLTLNLSGVGTSLVATGSVSMQLSTPGNYVLQFTASNEYGAAIPVVVPFTVATNEPVPFVAINTPASGAVYTRTEGDPATPVSFTFSGGTDFGTVQSVAVAIDGEPVAATINGLGTANITGSGSVSYSAGGTHSLVVTLSNGFGTATDQISFSIDEEAAESCLNLTWLPPITYHKTIDGGTVMPVRFTLECNGTFIRDESVLIAIYEVFADGSIGDPVLYPYGGTNPDEPDYAINGTEYQLDYTTGEGVHKYRVEVYKPLDNTGANLELLGAEHILTKAAQKDCKSDKSKKSYKSSKSGKCSKGHDHCKSHKSDKSVKSDKSKKSHKSDKSIKSGKSNKSHKSDKSVKSDKSNKSKKSDKSVKSDKSKKSDKKSVKSAKSSKAGAGNPGNNKPVGNAGENPNGDSDWGSGSKGKSDSSKAKSEKSVKSEKPAKSEKSAKSVKSSKAGAGNPGNNKPVGNAGENPNGDSDWGSGSNGKSDSSKAQEEAEATKKPDQKSNNGNNGNGNSGNNGKNNKN